MENYFRKAFCQTDKLLIILVLTISMLASCKDEYFYDDFEPPWLGSSIYDYLNDDGNFKNYIRLIDDLQYGEVLRLTGSKTLFVANDSAFNEFYKNNEWGVRSYEGLSLAQKKILFKFSMINNAYTLSKFANYNSAGVLIEETAMRQETALAAMDSIPFEMENDLPDNPYWAVYKTKGIHILKDNTVQPVVYFTKEFLNKFALTDEDFKVLAGGITRSADDVHLFNNKVIKRDITCKNGYIHVLQSVLVPPTNMAEYIRKNPETKIFSKLLDRFCAPFYDAEITSWYKAANPGFTDSIFVKKYFASNGGSGRLPSGLAAPNMLTFDPGWNSYRPASGGALESDMAAMFVPTDAAMTNYFNSGVGAILKNRFGSWENVPDYIILPFLKRHMRTSLIESVPSRFNKMVDAENYRLPVEKSHIEKTYTGVNGEVYMTNSVYPPVDYISVYSPVLLSENSKIMDWAINISETSVDGTRFAFYKLYLNSLVSRYTLFIPTDEYFSTNMYIDPVAWGQDKPAALKFWYNARTNAVNATVYNYDKTSGMVGDSLMEVITSAAFIKNRLWNILDSHIIVGDVSPGRYFVTKANDIVRVEGSGASMTVKGGADTRSQGPAPRVSNVFSQYNGTTYFLDKQINPALKSVYKVLSENPEFSMFFELLNGVPDTCVTQIFAQQGVDYRIKFFNAFRYTVYAPTNEAIQAAITANKITPWQTIYNLSNPERGAKISQMIRFLKYHFQDNTVFFGEDVNDTYQSATIKTSTAATNFGTARNKYLKIGVKGNSGALTLTMESLLGQPLRTAKVETRNGLYNIIAKDYIFAKKVSEYKNIDGTGSASGALFNTSLITTSASAVIHQIDNVLTFE